MDFLVQLVELRNFLLLALVTLPSDGGFPPRTEALKGLFPEGDVEMSTVYLSDKEQNKASTLAGTKVGKIQHIFRATKESTLIGTALIDINPVRAKKAAWLFGINPNHEIMKIVTLGFTEPRQYLPSDKWFEQFEDKTLDEKLKHKKGIDGITGATLSSRAVVNAARRALAIQKIIDERVKHTETP